MSYMYVPLQEDDKIAVFHLDPASGRLETLAEVHVPGGPAPLAIAPNRQTLYVGRRGASEISSFRIQPADGGLSLLGAVTLETDPCYIATDRSGRYLLSSYYEGSGVTVHPINDDGVVVTPQVQWLGTARGAHSIQTDPTNRFAFVPHIAGRGPNKIFQYRFDDSSGHLTPNSPATCDPQEELGPRHFCFHPSLGIVYFSNEQGCSVTAYQLDTSSGTLSPLQTVPTLPTGFDGKNSCAQIQITASGRFLYAPNRGHNSIACFSIDATGQLAPIGHIPAEAVPRAFSLDPGGNFLFAAGLESGRLASYRIDGATGKLDPLTTYEVGNRPMWVLVTSPAE